MKCNFSNTGEQILAYNRMNGALANHVSCITKVFDKPFSLHHVLSVQYILPMIKMQSNIAILRLDGFKVRLGSFSGQGRQFEMFFFDVRLFFGKIFHSIFHTINLAISVSKHCIQL